MKHCVAFDMDGVLIDSHDAVSRCYAACGVTMPDGAWGLPAREWLPDVVGSRWREVHDQKTKLYLTMLKGGEVLELGGFEWARRLIASGTRVVIVTGASYEVAQLVARRLHVPSRDVYAGCDLAAKAAVLRYLRPRLYVDDDERGRWAAEQAGVEFELFQRQEMMT